MVKETILVVDDSPTDRRLLAGPLQDQGYQVITASDGDEALAKASSQRPRLIVLDVLLPKKNGFQVCRQLKTGAETRDIKILIVTSKTQESDRFWGLKQGADGYLTKPVSDDDLLASVARLL
jgi:twitching motility two-component system response regulator PilH